MFPAEVLLAVFWLLFHFSSIPHGSASRGRAGGGKLVERITEKSLYVEWDVIGGRILFS